MSRLGRRYNRLEVYVERNSQPPIAIEESLDLLSIPTACAKLILILILAVKKFSLKLKCAEGLQE